MSGRNIFLFVVCVGIFCLTAIFTLVSLDTGEECRVVQSELTLDRDGLHVLNGEVRNFSEETYTNVVITFNFLDEDNNVVSTHELPLGEFNPKERQDFGFEVAGEDVFNYKIIKVTGEPA